jgi:hypothetical protein
MLQTLTDSWLEVLYIKREYNRAPHCEIMTRRNDDQISHVQFNAGFPD